MKIVLALSLMMAVTGCQSQKLETVRGSSKEMFPDHESWGSKVYLMEESRSVAVAMSDRMIKYDKKEMAHLIGNVEADFYNEEGGHVSRLFADSADIHMKSNQMSAFGHVIIRSDSGLVLHTQSIRWDDAYDMIATQDSVMFSTQDADTLYGIGFESDVDLTHWRIYKPWGVTKRELRDDS